LHPTHVFKLVSHEPVVPPHAEVFVGEHWRHAPTTHAGLLPVGHCCAAPVPLSLVHGLHEPVMQTARPPLQVADVTQL
jgi:hypothetical protein